MPGADTVQSKQGLRFIAVLLPLALALVLVPAASGATLYSNLTHGGNDSSGTGEVSSTAQRLAQPFVPTTAGTARLAGFYGVSFLGQTASVSVSIYSNNAGQPGTLLATGAHATIDENSDADPTCTALTGSPALAAGTTYWAVFQTYSNTAFWSAASDAGAGTPKTSANSGGTWGTAAYAARSLMVDDGTSCQPDIDTIPKPNPDPNAELGDMYAKPGGTNFQTLSASNKGVAQLTLTGGSFSGLSAGTPAGMFKVFDGDPNPDAHPPGAPFQFPKSLGSSGGGVILLYIGCVPPLGTADGMYTATFTLTSNDPDEGTLTWPVWCLIDSTPPTIEFPTLPNGRGGWFVTEPAPIQVRGVDPESGNRVIRVFCNDNGEASLDWKNGPIASFGIGPDGVHALSCQATDLAKNTSAPGAFDTTVKVDATPPDTAKGDVGPPAVSDETAFDFSFTGSDATSGVGEFECSLDGGDYELCASPVHRSGLGNATHTFDVRARDVAGNYDPTPVRWTWEVNAPPPEAADDAASASANAPLDIDVLANDVGPRGGALAIVLGGDTTEKGGNVSVAGSKVHYVPPAGFAGTDSFTYRAVSDTGVMSAPATVTIQVAPKSGPGAGGGPGGASCTVPKIKRGASLRAVKKALTAAGCTLGKVKRKHSSKVHRGKLIKLKPKAGTVLDAGAPVKVVLSSGP
jgi:hypothetical protein